MRSQMSAAADPSTAETTMSQHQTPLPPARVRRIRPMLRSAVGGAATLAVLLTLSCGGGSPSGPGGGGDATLSGTIRAAGSATALANATVRVGTKSASSDANGRF